MKVKDKSDVVCEDKGITYNVTHSYGKKDGNDVKPDPRFAAEGVGEGKSEGMTRDAGK